MQGCGQCGWGHSPCAKAARCPKTAGAGHPQASPSSQMVLWPPWLLSEVQRAPEPHRPSCHPPGVRDQHLPGPSPLCVWGSHAERSRVLVSWGRLAGLTPAALLVAGLVRAFGSRRAEPRPRDGVSPCAVWGDGLRGVGGQRGHLQRSRSRHRLCLWMTAVHARVLSGPPSGAGAGSSPRPGLFRRWFL